MNDLHRQGVKQVMLKHVQYLREGVPELLSPLLGVPVLSSLLSVPVQHMVHPDLSDAGNPSNCDLDLHLGQSGAFGCVRQQLHFGKLHSVRSLRDRHCICDLLSAQDRRRVL